MILEPTGSVIKQLFQLSMVKFICQCAFSYTIKSFPNTTPLDWATVKSSIMMFVQVVIHYTCTCKCFSFLTCHSAFALTCMTFSYSFFGFEAGFCHWNFWLVNILLVLFPTTATQSFINIIVCNYNWPTMLFGCVVYSVWLTDCQWNLVLPSSNAYTGM